MRFCIPYSIFEGHLQLYLVKLMVDVSFSVWDALGSFGEVWGDFGELWGDFGEVWAGFGELWGGFERL